MPYTSIVSLPNNIKNYSDKTQRMWMHVFNKTYASVLKETTSKSQAETRAFKSANAVLKNRLQNIESYSNHDYFNCQIDDYLGNL